MYEPAVHEDWRLECRRQDSGLRGNMFAVIISLSLQVMAKSVLPEGDFKNEWSPLQRKDGGAETTSSVAVFSLAYSLEMS